MKSFENIALEILEKSYKKFIKIPILRLLFIQKLTKALSSFKLNNINKIKITYS